MGYRLGLYPGDKRERSPIVSCQGTGRDISESRKDVKLIFE